MQLKEKYSILKEQHETLLKAMNPNQRMMSHAVARGTSLQREQTQPLPASSQPRRSIGLPSPNPVGLPPQTRNPLRMSTGFIPPGWEVEARQRTSGGLRGHPPQGAGGRGVVSVNWQAGRRGPPPGRGRGTAVDSQQSESKVES